MVPSDCPYIIDLLGYTGHASFVRVSNFFAVVFALT